MIITMTLLNNFNILRNFMRLEIVINMLKKADSAFKRTTINLSAPTYQ